MHRNSSPPLPPSAAVLIQKSSRVFSVPCTRNILDLFLRERAFGTGVRCICAVDCLVKPVSAKYSEKSEKCSHDYFPPISYV